MKAGVIFISLLLVIYSTSCKTFSSASEVNSSHGASISLVPYSSTFELEEVRRGAVGFTATIRNESTTPIKIAHPSICFPADYVEGEIRHLNDSHEKSEILLIIKRPDGADVVLRDGYFHYFDPGNFPLLTIPSNETGTFHVGWFFQNARGRWEKDEEAAKVFLLKGQYRIRIVFRNFFTRASVYNINTKANSFIDVWTGEMESTEVTIELR